MSNNRIEKLRKKASLVKQIDAPSILAVDLNDILESNIKVTKLIDEIDSLDKKDELEDLLINLEIELDHINWHYKSFKKQLSKLYE
ncbi:hypothetical protein [Halobacillus sp. Marseille-Q1614]|uniref:hypothetical protein n=1 Tax=Halobacillus sp. Marseille-Q1614 TaxID=2709134 RepID=UPI0015702A7F|nr:hypothetical protein [Halobacillus sp. Marseille-Q1614]